MAGVALVAGFVQGARADDRYFLATDGDWFEPANWDPPVIPAADDNVTVPAGSTVTLTADAEIADLNLDGGTLSGPGNLLVHGLLAWSGGALAGSGSVTAASDSLLEGPGLELAGRLVNEGAATLSGAGTVLQMRAGAVLENRAGATFEIQNDDGIATDGTGGRLINTGTLRRGISDGAASIGVALDNAGLLEVTSGALELTGGGSGDGVFDAAGGRLRFGSGTFQLASGARLVGHVIFGGATVAVDGAYDASTTEISGGTVRFGNAMGARTTALMLSGGILAGTAAVTIDGLLTWSGGAMRGAGTTTAAGDAALGGSLELDERRLAIAGNAILSGDDPLVRLGGGAVLENRSGATFDLQDDASLLPSGSGSATVENAGAFRRTIGTGTATIGVAFANSGVVEIASGTLHCGDAYRQTGGETRLSGGALAAEGGLDLAGGRLIGSGSIHGDVTNRATVAPGFSPARLHIDGRYTQEATGELHIEVGGRTAGSGFDQLAVDGTAVLDGRLSVALVDGFDPDDGDRFEVVTFVSRSGTFAAFDGLLMEEGSGFDAVAGDTGVALVFGRETCGNGGDDDGNGLADCLDPKCARADVCTGTPTFTPTAAHTATPTATATPALPTPTTAVPTATGTATPECAGDCDGDGEVSAAELVRAVHLALGSAAVEPCPPADHDRSGSIGIAELVNAVDRALRGCAPSEANPLATRH